MRHVSALSGLVTDTSALVHDLQRERGASGAFIGSKGSQMARELTAQRARTDTRLAAFEAEMVATGPMVRPPSATSSRRCADGGQSGRHAGAN